MNIHQPHVRLIVRGKVRARTEVRSEDQHQPAGWICQGEQDISYPGEQAVFERKRDPPHRLATGPKTGKRGQEQIPET